MLMAFFMFAKWWKFTTKKPLNGYITNIYFKISKTLDKVYNDFKDWAQMFSNKFDVGLVYVLKVGIIKINLKLLLIMSNIFFQIFDLNFLVSIFVVYIFPWICIIVSLFFPNKNCQVKIIWNQENMLVKGGGLIQLFKPKILPNSIVFPFTKETKRFLHH